MRPVHADVLCRNGCRNTGSVPMLRSTVSVHASPEQPMHLEYPWGKPPEMACPWSSKINPLVPGVEA